MLNKTSLISGILSLLAVINAGSTAAAAEPAREEYLADLQHRFLFVKQGFGELGINKSAHARGAAAQPLKIDGLEYARGLGHHAPGEIVIDLAGEYSRFECLVGVQTIQAEGTVVFQVFVDDELRFDSGVMKSDMAARQVSVDVSGKRELRLVVGDAGDGIAFDCANWVNARLVPADVLAASGEMLDIAPFAEVVTSDPQRIDGARSTRIQEYRQEDVYMETPVQADAQGTYIVSASADKPGGIGLKWMERRRLHQLELVASNGDEIPESTVQCWLGESAWQGGWRTLEGKWTRTETGMQFRPDWSSVPEARSTTRKIRFIFPSQAAVKSFKAMTLVKTGETALRVEMEGSTGGSACLELYNGELVGAADAHRLEWDQSRPMSLAVRYAKPRPWNADSTVLRFRLADGAAFGVSVDDVLKNGCVYVRDLGLFVTQDPPKLSLAEYKQSISNRQTILQEVRNKPDQTLAQAIDAVHHPAQNKQPMLLSLACDNHKLTVQQSGEVQFSSSPETDDQHVADMLDQSGRITPRFGSGKNENLTRTLEADWMPIPITTVEEKGISYRQRTFVAPLDERGSSAGVLEFTLENTVNQPADAELELAIWANASRQDIAEFAANTKGVIAFRRGRLIASVETTQAKPLQMELTETGVRLSGSLPARGTARVVVFIPTAVVKPEEYTRFTNSDALLRATREYWEQQLAKAMKVEVPDPLLANVIKASQVHCLLAARNEADGQRVAAWIGSVNYGPLESEAHAVIRGMDYFGHHDFARKSLDYFVHRYNTEGFLTTGYTIMGTGWHLWSLGEHYQLVRDKEWLTRVAPEVARVCKWVVRQREKTMHASADGSRPPEYGLMPPGIMADWNAFAYYFCLNGYFCTGLNAAADALADIGLQDAAGFKQIAAQFKEDILRAYSWTRALMPVYPLRDGTSVPGYPSQLHGPGPTANFFPGEDGNRSWCYDVELGSHHLVPFGILAPGSRETAWLMDHMEDVQFLSDGWFDYTAERSAKDPYNLGGFAKVQPYYCRNGEICAMRDDVKPFIRTYFNTIPSLLSMEILSFNEHFAGVAAWNKTHETGYFLHQTRLMMVMERGDELWLAPFVTTEWMKDGLSVAAGQAPTRFGQVSFSIKSAAAKGHMHASIEPPSRSLPRQIVLRLRHPEGKHMRKVTVNGQEHRDFDPAREIIRLAPTGEKIVLRASY